MSSGLTRSAATLIAVLGLSVAASATELPLTGDAYVSTARPSTNYGSSSNLYVGNGGTTYLQFGVTSLPAGTTSGQVSKATLLVFSNRVNTSASVSVNSCTTSWTEATVTSATAPTCASSVATFTPVVAGAYVAVDVTTLVQSWVSGSLANNGISLTSASGDILFDSKENDQTAHPAKLDVTLLNATGTVLSAGSGAGQVYLTGASGAVPSTPVSVTGDISLTSTGVAALTAGSVSTTDLASSSVTIPKISATGTPSSTTFLRGDGSWSTASGGVTAVSTSVNNATPSASISGSTLTINFPTAANAFNFYSTGTTPGGGTNYLQEYSATTAAPNVYSQPAACTLSGFNVTGYTFTAGTADTATFAVFKNGVITGTGATVSAGAATGISCSITVPTSTGTGNQTCSSATTAALAAGDNFYVQLTETGNTSSAAYFHYTAAMTCK